MGHLVWWEKVDSNHRSVKATDLQSAPFGHSGILPYSPPLSGLKSWWTDLNPRPADYKSAALPTELHQLIHLFLGDKSYFNTSVPTCQQDFSGFFFFYTNVKIDRGDRTWTCGILVPNQALYQTELRLADTKKPCRLFLLHLAALFLCTFAAFR